MRTENAEFLQLLQVGCPREPLAKVAGELEKLALTAGELAEARKLVETDLTDAKKDAGNYRKGHVTWQGLNITIENPKDSIRSGTAPDGKSWSSKMTHDYGYFKGTTGKDGDHVDVFIGPDLDCELVHVVHQVDPGSGNFDEHKVVIGASNLELAKQIYLGNYQTGWNGLGSVLPLTLAHFRWWLDNADTTKEIKDGYYVEKTAVDYADRLTKLIERKDPEGLQWCLHCKELWSDCRCPGKEKASKELDPSYSPEHPEECCPHCGARQERGDNGYCNRCGKDWPE